MCSKDITKHVKLELFGNSCKTHTSTRTGMGGSRSSGTQYFSLSTVREELESCLAADKDVDWGNSEFLSAGASGMDIYKSYGALHGQKGKGGRPRQQKQQQQEQQKQQRASTAGAGARRRSIGRGAARRKGRAAARTGRSSENSRPVSELMRMSSSLGRLSLSQKRTVGERVARDGVHRAAERKRVLTGQGRGGAATRSDGNIGGSYAVLHGSAGVGGGRRNVT